MIVRCKSGTQELRLAGDINWGVILADNWRPTPNPLTTDDWCTTYHATLAACYQLMQSVLNIGFVLAKKNGGIGGGGGHSKSRNEKMRNEKWEMRKWGNGKQTADILLLQSSKESVITH